ncbi:uncharacterized protein PHACADRAFT_140190 [Phanerochaete carnosa HHB-10118-sp]|uniref:Ubiquitin carboxyl-terminal hydrolase n=2 Tax=Phanerochaete carnosa (strain HHB-10118-sp) TaxID=650164 RepID=K5W3B8_PHACS|nr:uncharacterized protein PHACADRAFT_140190 [Phanerochaete carnosa HHB-10118-sp]EKM58343.1 hypothetical protein PHACADRAFT_140190 [Phanerochaete carnosa HHB-10118-sp]
MPGDFGLSAQGCSHLADLDGEEEKEIMLKRYKTVISWHMCRRHEAVHPAKRRKLSSPSCERCQITLSRPFVCLQCFHTACWRESHIHDHFREVGHSFCADSKSGAIYCLDCDDFVYDPTFTSVLSSTSVTASERLMSGNLAKSRKEPYKPWIPDSKDNAALEGAVALPCQGRRGLLNLGQTCFLNAILQSFLANPLLRNFFLSDKHNEKLCSTKDCTSCEMDRLFTEVYSGKGGPLGPISFLATTWKASPTELSGYAQQDAHEFFISALNQIHATSKGKTAASCICIVHTTFDGLLQSDVRCERCGNVTSTTDPMFDISLEIEAKGSAIAQDITLASCLRQYTLPEKLALNDYTCGKCSKASHVRASKRLSIRKLPPVLSFQFKRFEHPTADKSTARKIESPVRFPASLNMAEFTTHAMKSSAPGSKAKSTPDISNPGPDSLYEYDLFSVVCHEGSIDNGHYTCYTRHQDEWYRYDDDKVTHSTLGACLNSQVYMCFYVKRHLDYKPWSTPSYVKTREKEAVKEKEREREKEAAARMKEREFEDELLAAI